MNIFQQNLQSVQAVIKSDQLGQLVVQINLGQLVNKVSQQPSPKFQDMHDGAILSCFTQENIIYIRMFRVCVFFRYMDFPIDLG